MTWSKSISGSAGEGAIAFFFDSRRPPPACRRLRRLPARVARRWRGDAEPQGCAPCAYTLSHALRRVRGLGLLVGLAVAACAPGGNINPTLSDDAPRVVIETSLGDIVVGLYEETAPVSVANFLAYVDARHFDGTVFHRVMPGFMIQGGGYVREGGQFLRKETRAPIVLESDNGLRNLRGTLAMARMPSPDIDSARDQFFINLVDNQRLDRLGDVELGYAVFGVVLEGMDVVDAIADVDIALTAPFPEASTPVEDVVIRSIRRRR